MTNRRAAGWLTALAMLAASQASADELPDRDILLSDSYRRPVDFSAYAPPANAKPAKQRFEGWLRLSGKPSTRTVLALEVSCHHAHCGRRAACRRFWTSPSCSMAKR
jgi:hypothetical protein